MQLDAEAIQRLISDPRISSASVRSMLKAREEGRAMQDTIKEDREACRSLTGFIRRAWHVIEPGTPFVHGWVIDAMARHLEAVHAGQILRLIINVPPGFSKSSLVGVFFPMWCWGPCGDQWMRFVGVSHEQSLGVRDNLKCRRLVQSEWFQRRWPVGIASDQNEKLNFENVSAGFRQVATASNITGRRGDVVLVDDPISAQGANSVVERETVNLWFSEALPTRLNHPEKSAIVLVMQRLHEDDPTGLILSRKWGWEHLMLPMRFEPERKCYTSIGFEDPRTKPGELLFPERFPEKVVADLERTMGSFAVAGQFQQRPVPREGAMFKRHWLEIVEAIPAGTRFVRYWDLAATEAQFGADPAWTAGLKLGRTPDGRYIVADVTRMRAEGTGVRRLIRSTAKEDGPHCEIGFPQDPGQAGKVQGRDLVTMLAGFIARAFIESGDKITRAEPVAAQAEAGNLLVLKGDWNEAFLDELTTFPGSKFKDQVDALSGALTMISGTTAFGVSEEHFTVEGGPIASTWPRVAAIDVSPRHFTCVWGALEPSTDVIYITEAVSGLRQHMAIHARSVTQRGNWIPVLFDLEAHGRSKAEGIALAQELADLHVPLLTAPYSFESAVPVLADRLATAQIRVFANLTPWFAEYRRLSRDEKGQIDESQAPILRATGLITASGKDVAITENRARSDAEGLDPGDYATPGNSTGY